MRIKNIESGIKSTKRSIASCFVLPDSSPKGFTLLFASLISSLLLAVGLVIFDITLRELMLSSVVRDSDYAVYTADTGIECALYWDFKYDGASSAFATSSLSPRAASISCNGQNVSLADVVQDVNGATTTFTINMTPRPYCAIVEVAKAHNPTDTTIVSRGYNTCNASPQRIERSLQVNY